VANVAETVPLALRGIDRVRPRSGRCAVRFKWALPLASPDVAAQSIGESAVSVAFAGQLAMHGVLGDCLAVD
jgi:hypothetical protein